MKKQILLLALAATSTFFVSCGDDDDPVINPLVGEWELDEITVTNPPSGYSNVDGQEFSSLIGESSYIMIFKSDFTYERELENTVIGDLDDEGTWELEGEDLTLTFDDGDDELEDFFTDLQVIDDIDDKLKVSISDRIRALSDAILSDAQFQDTVDTQEEYNIVFEERSVVIDVTLELEFDKQD